MCSTAKIRKNGQNLNVRIVCGFDDERGENKFPNNSAK